MCKYTSFAGNDQVDTERALLLHFTQQNAYFIIHKRDLIISLFAF